MDNQKLSEKIDYTKELFGDSILSEVPEAISNNLKHNTTVAPLPFTPDDY
jgi:hypothetical protein